MIVNPPASGAPAVAMLAPNPTWYAFLTQAAELVNAGFPATHDPLKRPSERAPFAGLLIVSVGYYSLFCRIADLVNEGLAASPGTPIVARLPRMASGAPLAGDERPTLTYYTFISALVVALEDALAAI